MATTTKTFKQYLAESIAGAVAPAITDAAQSQGDASMPRPKLAEAQMQVQAVQLRTAASGQQTLCAIYASPSITVIDFANGDPFNVLNGVAAATELDDWLKTGNLNTIFGAALTGPGSSLMVCPEGRSLVNIPGVLFHFGGSDLTFQKEIPFHLNMQYVTPSRSSSNKAEPSLTLVANGPGQLLVMTYDVPSTTPGTQTSGDTSIVMAELATEHRGVAGWTSTLIVASPDLPNGITMRPTVPGTNLPVWTEIREGVGQLRPLSTLGSTAAK